jgi:hypothetical protein
VLDLLATETALVSLWLVSVVAIHSFSPGCRAPAGQWS